MNLKEALKGKLTEDEISKLTRGFEIIGAIAIISFLDETLYDKRKLIAETIHETNKHIKTVLLKRDDISGRYRVGKYEIIYGQETETTHKESGCVFRINPTKVYFSEKLGTERERIIDQVSGREEILCMFAGIGPFPITIAKKKDVKIDAVEINPDAVSYLEKNIKLNKVQDKINVYEGDVRKIIPDLNKKYNRILMPAPKGAEDFLDVALDAVKQKGIINFYSFAREDEIDSLKEKVKNKCRKLGKEIKILNARKCGHYAPYVFRIAIDFKVL